MDTLRILIIRNRITQIAHNRSRVRNQNNATCLTISVPRERNTRSISYSLYLKKRGFDAQSVNELTPQLTRSKNITPNPAQAISTDVLDCNRHYGR